MRRRRLTIAGPMLGRNPGYVTTQGEFLTDLFREDGYDVVSTSVHVGRIRRLGETAATLLVDPRDAEVVIIEMYSGLSFVLEDIASAIAGFRDKPIILHLHGGNMPTFAARFPRWTKRILDRAAALVAPSEFLAREMARFAPHIRVIPNVIELSGYAFKPRGRLAPRLFWMRAYHSIYNPVMAVRVLAEVLKSYPEATLVMAGQEKGMKAEVAETALQLRVSGSLELLEFLDEPEKRAVAARSDIFINTTHVDNAPVGVVEMCALGLPVVSTDVGGVSDLLRHGETGLLVPDNDDAEMTAAILRLLREPDLAARLSRNGPSVAASCAWPAVREKWEALFVEILPALNGAA